jgi:hypothetical protein
MIAAMILKAMLFVLETYVQHALTTSNVNQPTIVKFKKVLANL